MAIVERRIRKNEEIKAQEVRVIDEDGKQIGIMPLQEALQLARQRGLDLVEVAPQANPVVCKILDYGKYLYILEKREKKRPKARKLKEVRLSVRIEDHDFETKLRHIRSFLEEDNKVKVSIFFRGREIVHMKRGRELLERIAAALAGIAKVDQPPTAHGRSLQMLLVPLGDSKKEKGKEKEKEKEKDKEKEGERTG